MNPSPDPWSRLVAAARRVPSAEQAEALPLGFATRVVALAWERPERALLGGLERFSWRALGLAGALAVASAAWSVAPVLQAFAEDDFILGEDPVALVFELM
jgi:hypothetical protein